MSEANRTASVPGWDFLQQVGPKDRSWWRLPLLVTVGLVAALVAAGILGALVAAVAAIALSAATGMDPRAAAQAIMATRTDLPLAQYLPALAFTGSTFIALAMAFVGLAAVLYGRPIRSFLTAHPRFRWRAVLGGAVLTAPLMLIAIAAEWIWAPGEAPAPLLREDQAIGARLAYGLAAAVFLYLAALAEEILFRGWLQQQVGAFTRRVAVVLVVSALLFSLAHWDPNIDAFAARAAMGLAFGWLVLRTGGVEFASGAHFANNLMIALFVAPITLTMPEARSGFDWRGAILQPALLLALIGIVEWARRRPGLARALGLEQPAPPAANWF